MLSSGCAVLLPAKRDPTQEAEAKERATSPTGKAPTYPTQLFDPESVVTVKPLYSVAKTARTGPEYRLSGAMIQLRPVPTLSSDGIENLLNSHNARSELPRSRAPPFQYDPY